MPDAAPMTDIEKTKARLLDIIRQKSLITSGGPFRLASGVMSDYYLDMKPTIFSPEGLNLIADLIFEHLRDDAGVNSIGGLELGAVPIVTAVSMRSFRDRGIDGFVVRKEAKDHGTAKKIDGNFRPNTNVVLIEDVTTKGGSVMQAVRAVRAQGATVKKVITIVDRLEGATAALQAEGIELVPLCTIKELRNN
jgi:orotate phosphoribosyltransferase